MPDKQIVIIGDGPEFSKVKNIADKTDNIKLLGYQSDDVLADYMARARAFIFAAEEDFGITPVEAQACGTPIIAYAAGGALETVIDDHEPRKRTGLFFAEQTVASLTDAVSRFENSGKFLPEACRANAERFSQQNFIKAFSDISESLLNSPRA
jgi:glycosyltransferase involved in cell wall biosynthesis